jgi:hypothetical protein
LQELQSQACPVSGSAAKRRQLPASRNQGGVLGMPAGDNSSVQTHTGTPGLLSRMLSAAKNCCGYRITSTLARVRTLDQALNAIGVSIHWAFWSSLALGRYGSLLLAFSSWLLALQCIRTNPPSSTDCSSSHLEEGLWYRNPWNRQPSDATPDHRITRSRAITRFLVWSKSQMPVRDSYELRQWRSHMNEG